MASVVALVNGVVPNVLTVDATTAVLVMKLLVLVFAKEDGVVINVRTVLILAKQEDFVQFLMKSPTTVMKFVVVSSALMMNWNLVKTQLNSALVAGTTLKIPTVTTLVLLVSLLKIVLPVEIIWIP